MKGSVLRDKAEAFASRIIKLNKYLVKEKREYTMSNQVLRCGTSISANLAEAQFAQSDNDFIAKMCIAQKEANETYMWLRHLYHGDYITELQYISMENDTVELLKMLTASIKTMRSKTNN